MLKRVSVLAGLCVLYGLVMACATARAKTPYMTIVGPWSGGEREAFMTVIDAFTARTKIAVSYESMHDEMGSLLRMRVAQGNPPQVALVPRPGEVAEFARAGNLVDLSKFIPNEDLTRAFGQSFINLGKVDGRQVGVFFKANSKSTFWYKPDSLSNSEFNRPGPSTTCSP
jgi:alpha-glucoside transport system substrate-binding protein